MSRRPVGTWLLWLAGVAVAAAVVAALLVMGSPQQQRQIRLDIVRADNLAVLQIAVRDYWREHQRLPESLAELAARPGVRLPLDDPGGHPPYRYRVVDAGRFELCATFATDTASKRGQGYRVRRDWPHGSGEHCFVRTVRESRD